jgi:hypothetical protein
VKEFHTLVGLRHPASHIGAAIRDRLSEIASSLDDVERITTVSRDERADGGILLVNEWRVNPRLPAALCNVITPDKLGWLDYADWSADLSQCRWRIEPFFFVDAIRCEGTTRIEPAMGGRGARATFEGTLTVDPVALSAVPVMWRKSATTAIEILVGTLIPKNFRKTTDAISALLGECDQPTNAA